MAENTKIEYKREFSEKIKVTAVAFLNTGGGEIYVGIDDDGNIVGIANPDEEMQKCASSLKNSIKPDITPFVRIDSLVLEDKPLIKITVLEGVRKPYYLAEKGLRPSGVFIRMGSASIQADESFIRQMIRDADKDTFEERVSIEQDLSFRYAEKCFKDKKIAFGSNEMRTLGFVNANGQYTNLALLCSEQNPYSIKFSVFQGTDKAVFLDRKELTGSLFEQLDDAMKAFAIYNKTPAYFSGLSRIDKPDYSEQSVREALLNAEIHRDYNYSGAILFNVYDDRIEIMSLGGLVRGLTKRIILRGVSETRNDKLAKVFFRLGYVEAYGTGIPRILTAYMQTEYQPEIEIFSNAFNIILPNMNYTAKIKTDISTLSETEKVILKYLQENDSIDKDETAALLSKKPDTAYRLLEKLVRARFLQIKFNGQKKEYCLSGIYIKGLNAD